MKTTPQSLSREQLKILKYIKRHPWIHYDELKKYFNHLDFYSKIKVLCESDFIGNFEPPNQLDTYSPYIEDGFFHITDKGNAYLECVVQDRLKFLFSIFSKIKLFLFF